MSTKITLEIHYPAIGGTLDEKHVFTSEKDRWDSSLDDMLDMFRGILQNAGFVVGELGEIEEEC